MIRSSLGAMLCAASLACSAQSVAPNIPLDQQLQDAAGHSEIQWTDACAALNSETFWNAVKRGESID